MPYKDRTRQNKFQREANAARRHGWLQSNGPCVCGSWNDLEVDHVDPATKTDHKVWSWAESRRLVELAKCQVLCKTCHRTKTMLEQHRPTIHGTARGAWRCRCSVCLSWVAKYRREYRKRTGHR